MSGSQESNGPAGSPGERAGVLGSLPKTRPQRSSPRRAASRRASGSGTPSTQAVTASASATGTRPKPADATPKARAKKTPAAAAKPARKAGARKPLVKTSRSTTRARAAGARTTRNAQRTALPPVPRQGFASEGDRATGSVQAPGGTELVGSAAEILGELAKVGISTGERLLRDVFSRLPG